MPAFAANRSSPHARAAARPDPRLHALLSKALWLGATLVLLFPELRGTSDWLGWLPLWLLGMPLSALWALHGFRLRRPAAERPGMRAVRRHRGVQARRRALPRAAAIGLHAAGRGA